MRTAHSSSRQGVSTRHPPGPDLPPLGAGTPTPRDQAPPQDQAIPRDQTPLWTDTHL